MGLLHLLVAALAASAVMAADTCAPVNPVQTIDPILNPMIFFQQPTIGGAMNGVTCSMNVDFIANLDAGADDDYALQIQLLTNKLGDGTLSVDGMNDTLTITSNTPPGLLFPRSTDTSITIHFTEGATNNGEFMIVVQKVKGRPDKPVVKVTTPAPVTAPYDPKFKHNPLLVANDIMLAFDMSSKNIDKYQTFARNLIKELTINPKPIESTADDEDCEAGSRLTVVGLSALSGFDNLYAPYWTTSSVQADGNIGSIVQIASGSYYFGPVDTKYAYGFAKPKDAQDTDTPYTTCKNRGKIFILFSNSPPAECDMSKTDCKGSTPLPQTNFLDLGVHQILVHYNMVEADKKYYDLYNKTAGAEWNYFELSGGAKDVENFVNTFLVDSSEQMTCQLKSKTDQTEVFIGQDKEGSAAVPTVSIDLPAYYNGKGVSGGVWDTTRHYCNFQETMITLKRDLSIKDPAPVPVCVKVYYDLETGKDFVSIFSGDPKNAALQKEIVRLTGRDVSGTSFDLPDAIGSIVFSSDEKNVYDGFHAEITRGNC